MSWEIIQGDAREMPLDDDTVDLIVCSPPYWGLRSYRDDGEHYDGQIGSETTPAAFVDELVGMIDGEWRRVLKPEGSLWLNLGDKYAGSDGRSGTPTVYNERAAQARKQPKRAMQFGAVRAKSLMGLPWRIAIALIDAGWILRAEVIWSKPNGLPESVRDRVRRSHENWFHFVLEPRYFSAVDELRAQTFPSGLVIGGPHDPFASVGIAACEECGGRIQSVDLSDQEGPYQGGKAEHSGGADGQRRSGARVAAIPFLVEGDAVGVENAAAFGQDGLIAAVDHQAKDGTSPVSAVCEGDTSLSVDDPGEPSKVCMCSHPTYHSTLGRLPGSVWSIPTEPLLIPDSHRAHYGLPDHFAAFPTEWPRRLIRGWSPSGICSVCGEGRRPVVDADAKPPEPLASRDEDRIRVPGNTPMRKGSVGVGSPEAIITGYECACPQPDAPTRSAVILDPMAGTGTVPGVAHALGRHGIGVDLSADYCNLSRWRIQHSTHFDKVHQRTMTDRQGRIF